MSEECPHCGNLITDLWDYVVENDPAETTCPDCNGSIIIESEVMFNVRKGKEKEDDCKRTD